MTGEEAPQKLTRQITEGERAIGELNTLIDVAGDDLEAVAIAKDMLYLHHSFQSILHDMAAMLTRPLPAVPAATPFESHQPR